MVNKIQLPAFKGAIFDLDGTILDSMGIWRKIDEDFLGRRGFEVPEDYVEKIKALDYQSAAEYTIARFSLKDQPEDLIAEWKQMAEEAYAHHIFLKPHVKEYIMQLKHAGIKIALATVSDDALSIPALKNNGVFEYFDAFVTTQEVGKGKEFPDVYLKAAEKLGLKPQSCIVFEDVLKCILGAKKGGFCTIGVYDAASEIQQEAIQKEADYYILDFSML